MQGVVLSVRTAQSLILGDDGIRYTFTPGEWQNDNVEPQVGMRVDFEVRGADAVDIFPVPGAAPAQPPAPVTSGVPTAQTPTPTPPAGERKLGMRKWHWALAGVGALIVLGMAGAFVLDVFPTSSADQQASIYESLLATIPDTPEVRQHLELRIFDYALARQIFPSSTFPLPGPGDDEDAVAAFKSWQMPLEMVPDEDGIIYPTFGAFSLAESAFAPLGYRSIDFRHFAFDIRNIDQTIRANTTGPSRYDVARGRFNPQAADATLKACVECPAPGIEKYKGITYYSWGEDYTVNPELILAPPAFDELGRGGRIAVLEDYVIRTLGTPDMKAAIDAHLRQGPSLADVDEFRLLAKSMSRLGVYAMFLNDRVEGWELSSDYAMWVAARDASQAEVEAKERELSEAGPWLRPYDAVGVGFGKDEEGRFFALVLVHKGGDFAEENAGLLRRIIEEESSAHYDMKWSEYIDINNLEINAEGRLLLAKMRGRIDVGSLEWLYFRDNLILYEQE